MSLLRRWTSPTHGGPVCFSLGLSLVLGGCGARSDLSGFGSGGAGGATAATTVVTVGATTATTGAGGSVPHCDPPKQATEITVGLTGAIEVQVHGDLAYVLRTNDVVEVPLCGANFHTLATNQPGFGSLRGFVAKADGVYWASSGPSGGGALGKAPLDGSAASFESIPGILTVTGDDLGVYYATQSGEVVAESHGTKTQLASETAIAYWSPLVVDSGWVYWAFADSSVFGQLIRVRRDAPGPTTLVSLRIPDDLAVSGNTVFAVTAHGFDEVHSIDVTNPVLSAIAIVPTPLAIAVDPQTLYVADQIGIERSPHDGSNVQPLVGKSGVIDVTLTDTAFVWLADDGTLSWAKKPK